MVGYVDDIDDVVDVIDDYVVDVDDKEVGQRIGISSTLHCVTICSRTIPGR